MVKASDEELNENEISIFTELQNNAKENIEKLAKRSGFLVQKVRRTI